MNKSTSNTNTNLGFKTKTRAFEKNQVFERENERKEYRMGELDEIYGQFLARSFDFPNFGAIWRERALSLFSSLFGRSTHRNRERGGGRERVLQNRPLNLFDIVRNVHKRYNFY